MADLKNELQWSRTRVGTFHACKRQYYFQYYHKWGGWEWNAPKDVKQTYFLTKLSSLPMMVGDAVHQAIKKLLEQKAQYGRFTLEDPALFARKEILTRRWRDALAERWREKLKTFPPVFEVYYDELPTKEKLKEYGAKVTRCLETFLASDLARELQDDDPKRWLAIDPDFREAPELKFEGRKIAALPDFARRLPDGTVEVWDWKTGKPGDKDELQLLSYALFAQQNWLVGPEQIRLYAFYLDPDVVEDGVQEIPCTDKDFERIRRVIREDFRSMEELLVDREHNVPKAADPHFPMIEDGWICRGCKFKELCGR